MTILLELMPAMLGSLTSHMSAPPVIPLPQVMKHLRLVFIIVFADYPYLFATNAVPPLAAVLHLDCYALLSLHG